MRLGLMLSRLSTVGLLILMTLSGNAIAQAPGELPSAQQAQERAKIREMARQKARGETVDSTAQPTDKTEEETDERLSKKEEEKRKRLLEEAERKKADQERSRALYDERWVKMPGTNPTIGAPLNRPGDKPTSYTLPSPSSRPDFTTIDPKRQATPVVRLPRLKLDRLPLEATQTLLLIQRGGPFPHYQDGSIFQNRERRLPMKQRGYYREYTVPTPGSPDRGLRRIVRGAGGELYYTDNHYKSFKQVVN